MWLYVKGMKNNSYNLSDILKGLSRIQRAPYGFPNHWIVMYFGDRVRVLPFPLCPCSLVQGRSSTNNTDTNSAGHHVCMLGEGEASLGLDSDSDSDSEIIYSDKDYIE